MELKYLNFFCTKKLKNKVFVFLDSRFSDRRKIEIIDVKNDSVVKIIMTKNENEFECWTCQPPFFQPHIQVQRTQNGR